MHKLSPITRETSKFYELCTLKINIFCKNEIDR